MVSLAVVTRPVRMPEAFEQSLHQMGTSKKLVTMSNTLKRTIIAKLNEIFAFEEKQICQCKCFT